MADIISRSKENRSHKLAALNIYDVNSNSSAFFQILAPFQITYEFSSGIDQNDYFNSLVISPDNVDAYFFTMEDRLLCEATRPLHQHDYFELMIVLEGSILQRIEDKEYLYPQGTCCLINRNLLHTERFQEQAKLLFIGLSAELTKEIISSYGNAYFIDEKNMTSWPIFDFLNSDLNKTGEKSYMDFIPRLDIQSEDMLYQYSEELIKTVLFPQFGTSYIVKGQLCALIQYLSENYYPAYVKLDSSVDYLLFSRASRLINASDGHISRKELARLLHYSEGHIARIIKKYTGMCLYDYEMDFCLKKAAHLLLTTSKSVSSIMETLHFTNRTHFYKLFKDKYGVSPGEYRRHL